MTSLQHEFISVVELADKVRRHRTTVAKDLRQRGYAFGRIQKPSGRYADAISAADAHRYIAEHNTENVVATPAVPQSPESNLFNMTTRTENGREKTMDTDVKNVRKPRTNFTALDNRQKGKLLFIAVKDLVIPDHGEQGYQREAVTGHASRIAADFNWRLFGVLDVVKRLDLAGRLEVADGGNRLRAAKMRGDVSEVPCIVHTANTNAEAATIFTGININRRAISFAPLHKAMLLAQDHTHQLAQQAWDLLNKHGKIFEPMKPLLKFCRKEDEREAMLRIIPVMQELAMEFPKTRITSDFFKGLITLEIQLMPHNVSVCEPKYIKKMKALGLSKLTDFAGLVAIAGRNPMMYARELGKPAMAGRILVPARLGFPRVHPKNPEGPNAGGRSDLGGDRTAAGARGRAARRAVLP